MKTFEFKLKTATQERWIYKISMGQNTVDGDDGENYHLGSRRWEQMASSRCLSLTETDLDFAIGCLENYADSARDNNDRSDQQSATRLAIALKKLKEGVK